MRAARKMDEMTDVASERLDDIASRAGDVAARAGEFVQARMGEMSERAQGVVRDANDRLERLTGRRVESWTAEARGFVREHPLQALAFTVGLGYVLGKVIKRG